MAKKTLFRKLIYNITFIFFLTEHLTLAELNWSKIVNADVVAKHTKAGSFF